MNDPTNIPMATLVGGPCRIAWCEREHPAPGPHQVYVAHQADVAEQTLIDGTTVEVIASWWDRLDDQPAGDPEVVVYTDTDDETASVGLAPGTAGMLAEALALTDAGSWLGGALAEAAALLGYTRDEETGTAGSAS